jgi:hypothetical protein
MGMIHRALHSHSEIKVQCFPVLSTQDLGTTEVPTHKGQVMCILCWYPNTDDSMTHFEFHRHDRYLNHFIITHYCVRVMWNISWFLMPRLLFLSLFGDTCGAIKFWGNSCRQECMDRETWKFQSCKSSRDAHIAWQALNLGWWDGAWLLIRISDYGLCHYPIIFQMSFICSLWCRPSGLFILQAFMQDGMH